MTKGFKTTLGDREFTVALWISAIALGIVFFAFYHYQFTEWKTGGVARDYKDHLDTALSFVEYCDAYHFKALEVFKAENRYSHVIAYPAWHVLVILASKVFGLFGAVLTREEVLVFSVVSVNVLLLLASYLVIARYFRKLSNGIAAIIASVCVMFCGPLDNLALFDSYYLGAYTGNLWHNPTYLAVKPLAIACFLLFADILADKSAKFRDYAKAAVLLGLSAFCKPSFYQCFVPALVVYCVLHWAIARDRETFLHFAKVAGACVPIALVAAFQSGFALSGDGGAGLSMEWLYVIEHYTEQWVRCILLSVAFPLLVFVLAAVGRRWNGKVELALWTLVSALAMYLLFYIDISPFAGDFSWAVGLALNIGFVVGAGELLRWWSQGGTVGRILAASGAVLFAAHVLCGLLYFLNVWETSDFLCKYGLSGSLADLWRDNRSLLRAK